METSAKQERHSSLMDDNKSEKSFDRSASLSPSQDAGPLEQQQEQQPSQPSESDWASLSQIIVAFFITFNTWGLINSYGVFQTFYIHSDYLHRSNSQISWIGSFQASLVLFTLILFGPLFDRGYARTLISVGTFLNVFGMMMTSIASEYWQLMLCQGLCVGLGLGALFIVAVGQIALTFQRRRSMALGLAQTGGSIGAIIYTEVFRNLQPRVGFGWATRTIGFIMLGTLLVSCVLLKPYILPKPRRMLDMDALKCKAFDVFAVGSFLGFIGLYIPFFYIQQYSLTHGLTHRTNLAYSMIAILNTGSVFGRIIPGFVADELGLLNTYAACSIGTMVFGFIWIACQNLGGIVAFSLLYGFFSGCVAALLPGVFAALAPTPNLVGTWVGMGCLVSACGLLIGNPLGGLVLGSSGWVPLQLWCACFALASTLATIATRLLRGGSKLSTKV